MVMKKDAVSVKEEMSATERAEKIDACGGLPLGDFSRYTKKGRVMRNELGDALGINKPQLTRLLSTIENTGFADELEEVHEATPGLADVVAKAFEEYGSDAGLLNFLRHPNVAKGTVKDLQKLFMAYGFFPDWASRD